MHYRRMYDDSEMLYAYDLEGANGRDVVLQIEKVWGGELTGEKGRKTKKPFVKFVGKEKKLALNKTNGKAIATMYGADTKEWEGKYIAIYATTTEYNGEQRECIRVRPRVPDAPRANGSRGSNKQQKSQPPLTDGQIEKSFKDQGLIDETSAERRDAIINEAHERVDARTDLTDEQKTKLKAEMTGYVDDGAGSDDEDIPNV